MIFFRYFVKTTQIMKRIRIAELTGGFNIFGELRNNISMAGWTEVDNGRYAKNVVVAGTSMSAIIERIPATTYTTEAWRVRVSHRHIPTVFVSTSDTIVYTVRNKTLAISLCDKIEKKIVAIQL